MKLFFTILLHHQNICFIHLRRNDIARGFGNCFMEKFQCLFSVSESYGELFCFN